MSGRFRNTAAVVTTTVIAVATAIAMAVTPVMGDGHHYRYVIGKLGVTAPDVVILWGKFFLSTNGRLFDVLSGTMLYFLPTWVFCGLCGLMTGVCYLMTARCATALTDRRSPALTATLFWLTAMLMPWWDSSVLGVVSLNYVWPIALTLVTMWVLFYSHTASKIALWATVVVAAAAGAGHEACGGPLSAALAVWIVACRRYDLLRGVRGVIVAAFVIGSFSPYLSPAAWRRLGNVGEPDDVYTVLLVKNCFLVLGLIMTVIFYGVSCRSGRLRELAATPWSVWALAAVVSMVVSTTGGIVGRPGWFAQTWALIALTQLLSGRQPVRRGDIAGTVMMGALCCYMAYFAIWQVKVGGEARELLRRFKEHPSEPVAMDYTMSDEIPAILAGRTMPVANPDMYALTYGTIAAKECDSARIVVIPEALRRRNLSDFRGEERIGRLIVTSELPGAMREDSVALREGVEYRVTGFEKDGRHLWLLRPDVKVAGQR